MPEAPRSLEFDHLPLGDEAAVFFAPHNASCWVRLGDRTGVLTLELGRLPIRTTCFVLAVVAACLVNFGDRFRIPLDGNARIQIAVLATMIIASLDAIGTWLNRTIDALNPILAYDRASGKIRLSERDYEVSVDDVVELIDWRMTSRNYTDLGYKVALDGDGRGPPMRQIMLLTRIGERFRLEFLYKDQCSLYPRGKDPALMLAQVLNRPVRKLTKSATVRDLRPVDPFTKRF